VNIVPDPVWPRFLGKRKYREDRLEVSGYDGLRSELFVLVSPKENQNIRPRLSMSSRRFQPY